MKTAFRPIFLGAALAAAFLAGCSTPETRIRQNPDLFAKLTAGQQDMIKHGKVDLGFTKDMVRLALGEPDRISTRKDAGGESVVWHYITYEDPGGALLYRGWYHRSYFWHDPFYPWYTDYPERRERERFSIVLRDDKVIALEHESADGR